MDYETLKVLVKKGIVNYLPKGKRRIFQAEDPSRLLALAEEKQQELRTVWLWIQIHALALMEKALYLLLIEVETIMFGP